MAHGVHCSPHQLNLKCDSSVHCILPDAISNAQPTASNHWWQIDMLEHFVFVLGMRERLEIDTDWNDFVTAD